MSEILDRAKAMQQSVNEQSENIKETVNSEFSKLNKHIKKHIELSANTISKSIQGHSQSAQQALNRVQMHSLMVFTLGVILGAVIPIGILALAIHQNWITLTIG